MVLVFAAAGALALGALALRPRLRPEAPTRTVFEAMALGEPTVPEARAELVEQALESPSLSAGADWDTRARETIASRPNVVMITLESAGANRFGFMGYRRDVTPNLDRIAEDGLVFERAYTTATHSNYAQMSILSSLFPRRGKTLDMYGRIDYPRHLMHDLAHALGYAAATISSQDESWQGMLRFQTTGTPTYLWNSPDFHGEHLDLISEDIAPDHETAAAAVKWIDAHQSEPFSLYVNFQSTHFPYPIPKDAARPWQPTEPKGTFNFLSWQRDDLDVIENRYDDALHYVDEQVGVVFDALASRGLADRTILVVAADHGELFFDHGLVTHGRTLFDEETRVPFVIRYPPLVAPERIASPVSTLDIVPTILELLGVPPHPAHQGERVRWAGLPGGGRRGAIFMNIQGWKHLSAVVCLPFKLVFDPETETAELYDLSADPREQRDVALDRPEVARALREVLLAQIDAQQRYHQDSESGRALRADRFAPNMLPCPAW
jgi:arylsulfatase A-like enzyme